MTFVDLLDKHLPADLSDMIFIGLLVLAIFSYALFRTVRYCIKHRTLRKLGWPPEHCDANGEAVEASTPSDENPDY